MAPIKFEEDLKKTLEKRTITPSEQAWDTLSSRLDVVEQKESKTGLWWLAIAASVIGFLLVSYPFFKNDMTTTQSPTIVDTNKGNTIKIEEKNEIPSKIQTERTKQELVNNAIEKTTIQPLYTIKKDIQNKQMLVSTSINERKRNEDSLLVAQRIIAEDPILVVNKNQESIINNGSTIDSLLSKARRDIAMGELNKNTNVPIDHNELLQDVEDDLEETFRDKLLKTVRKGYSSIREELAERND